MRPKSSASPRDVYDGIFNLPQTKEDHAIVVKGFNYAELQNLVRTFSMSHGLVSDFLHQVIAVFPHPLGFLRFDHRKIDFKSIRIKNEGVELMQLQEDQPLRKMHKQLRGAPGGSTLM